MNGILLIDKPEGWTSHDIAAKLKGMLRERRIGHSGTLDPMATGLLVMFVGRATRAVEFAEAQSKRYIAGLRLGVSTDTQDTTGNILRSCEASVTREALADAIKPFIGDIMQIPPMYSAIKVNGQKLCDIARRGGEVERKPRPVTIYELELLEQLSPADYRLRIRCSKGTYVRTLCHDIGQALSCGGCMASLRRTMAAGYTLDESHTLEQVQAQGEALLRPVDTLFRQHPAYHITHPRVEQLCRNGNAFTVKTPLDGGIYRVYGTEGDFLCLSRLENGQMTSIKNFFGA